MKVIRTLILTTMFFCVVECCKKDETTGPDDGNLHIIEVTCPQFDIPWPSLADSPWPMYLHDPQHTSRSPYLGPQIGEFQALAQTGYEIFSSPAITVDGLIIIGADGLYAFTSTGEEIWHFEPPVTYVNGSQILSSPLIAADGTIYVGCSNGNLYAITMDGNEKWAFDTGAGFHTYSPNISKDGSVIYASNRNGLFAVDTTGQLVWRYDIDPNYRHYSSPAISPDGHTIYTISNGTLYAVNDDGSLKWEVNLGLKGGSPALDNQGNIYIHAGYAFYSLNSNGDINWSCDKMQSRSTPCIGYDGTIYTQVFRNAGGIDLCAIDCKGNLKWRTPFAEANLGIGSPSVDVESNIYCPADHRTINFLAVNSDGTVKYTLGIDTPGGIHLSDINTSPVICQGKVYMGVDNTNPKCLILVE